MQKPRLPLKKHLVFVATYTSGNYPEVPFIKYPAVSHFEMLKRSLEAWTVVSLHSTTVPSTSQYDGQVKNTRCERDMKGFVDLSIQDLTYDSKCYVKICS